MFAEVAKSHMKRLSTVNSGSQEERELVPVPPNMDKKSKFRLKSPRFVPAPTKFDHQPVNEKGSVVAGAESSSTWARHSRDSQMSSSAQTSASAKLSSHSSPAPAEASTHSRTRIANFGRTPKFPRYLEQTSSTQTSSQARACAPSFGLQMSSLQTSSPARTSAPSFEVQRQPFFRRSARNRSTQTSPPPANAHCAGCNCTLNGDKSGLGSIFRPGSKVRSIPSAFSNRTMECENMETSCLASDRQASNLPSSFIQNSKTPSIPANSASGRSNVVEETASPAFSYDFQLQMNPGPLGWTPLFHQPDPTNSSDEFVLDLSRMDGEGRGILKELWNNEVDDGIRDNFPHSAVTITDFRFLFAQETKYEEHSSQNFHRNFNETSTNSEMEVESSENVPEGVDVNLIEARRMVKRHLKPLYPEVVKDKDIFDILAGCLVRKLYDYSPYASDRDVAEFVRKIVNVTNGKPKEDIANLVDQIQFECSERNGFF